MPRRKWNVAGKGSESQEQQALFRWWRLFQPRLAPGRVMYAIPNGGRRDAATGARLKAEGVLAGVPDVFLACPRTPYAGLYIELKRKAGGRASPAQKAMLATLEESGYAVAVCYGWRQAASCIEAYLAGRWEASNV